MIQFIFLKRHLPVLNIYTNLFIPKRFGGYNIGFINLIKPAYKNDIGLVKHEIHHSYQFYQNPIKYTLGRWVKYFKFLPKKWIQWSQDQTYEYELDAYAYQLYIYKKYKVINEDEIKIFLVRFSNYIINYYDVGNKSFSDTYNKLLKRYHYYLTLDREDY